MWRTRCLNALAGAFMVAATTAPAQDYPNRLIRIVVASPGGGSDFTARRIANGISGPLGQTVMVDYRGAGLLSAENVMKSPPDGYTYYVTGSTLWVMPLFRKVPYDAEKDFAPVTLTDQTLGVLVVHPSVPAKSVKELLALVKARPGELNYAASSPGGPTFFAGESLKLAGVKVVSIPFKAAGQSLTAVVSGELEMTITDAVLVMPHVKSNRLRALAVAAPQPSALAPGLATLADAGLPGVEMVGRTGVWAPAKTPSAFIGRINQEISRYLNRPDVKQSFLDLGTEVFTNTPEQFAALIRSEIAKVTKLMKDANIKIE